METKTYTLIKHPDGTVRPEPVWIKTGSSYGIRIHGFESQNTNETVLRVLTAIQSSGFALPSGGVQISIRPGSEPLSSHDAAIAAALLIATRQATAERNPENFVFTGQTLLNGEVRQANGCCELIGDSGMRLKGTDHCPDSCIMPWLNKKTEIIIPDGMTLVAPKEMACDTKTGNKTIPADNIEDLVHAIGGRTKNWSVIRDKTDNPRDVFRSYYNRKQWEHLSALWELEPGEDRMPMIRFLSGMSDEQLMMHISDTHEIEIRETTWLYKGSRCLFTENGNEKLVTIQEIPGPVSGPNMKICVSGGFSTKMVKLDDLKGFANERCPVCGKRMTLPKTVHGMKECTEGGHLS